MSEMVETESDFNPNKIFVGNLPFAITSEDLSGLFTSYGRIIGVNIREDRLTGKPKGFAFLTFELEESASSAIANMNNYNYDGRALTVKRANLRGGEAARRDSEANSWKSIPTPSPLERKKSAKKDAAIKAKTGVAPKPVTKRPTWDTWVGPAEVSAKAAAKTTKPVTTKPSATNTDSV